MAADLGIKRTTAYMIVKKEDYSKTKCGGRREKLVKANEHIKRKLFQKVKSNPSVTLQQLKSDLDGAVSTSTIDRVLDGHL